jgi:hypothetical protein
MTIRITIASNNAQHYVQGAFPSHMSRSFTLRIHSAAILHDGHVRAVGTGETQGEALAQAVAFYRERQATQRRVEARARAVQVLLAGAPGTWTIEPACPTSAPKAGFVPWWRRTQQERKGADYGG